MNISRRDLCVALPTFVGTGASTTVEAKPLLNAATSGQLRLSQSEVFSPDQMPVTTKPNGAKSWNILHGVLATGEAISVHESLQPAGIAPSPPHAIQHSELILVREGTLLFEHDGKSERVGPGGVILVSFGTTHDAKNVGDGPARYVVVAIGGDTK